MSGHLTSKEWLIFLAALVILVLCSVWQNQRLRTVQLHQKQALYAERLRVAQIIIENEMLAAAYLTSTDQRTRERARFYLERSPQ